MTIGSILGAMGIWLSAAIYRILMLLPQRHVKMMVMIQNTPFYWFHRDISPDDPEFTELIRQAELAVDHGVFPQRIYQV